MWRASCYALVLVSCAIVPKPHLIEVMEANRLGDGIDEGCIWDGLWYNIGKVDPQEVCIPNNGFVIQVANLYQDEEDDSDEIDKDCEYS